MFDPRESANNLQLLAALLGKEAAKKLLGKYKTVTKISEASFDELVQMIGRDKAIKAQSPNTLNSVGLKNHELALLGKIDDDALGEILTRYNTVPELEQASFGELVHAVGRADATVIRATVKLAEKVRAKFPSIQSPAMLVDKFRKQRCELYPYAVFVAPLDSQMRCPRIKMLQDPELENPFRTLPGYTSTVSLITFHRHGNPLPTSLEEFYFEHFFKKASGGCIRVMDHIIINANWKFFSVRLQINDDRHWGPAPNYKNQSLAKCFQI